jgi:hypothetical protein
LKLLLSCSSIHEYSRLVFGVVGETVALIARWGI